MRWGRRIWWEDGGEGEKGGGRVEGVKEGRRTWILAVGAMGILLSGSKDTLLLIGCLQVTEKRQAHILHSP